MPAASGERYELVGKRLLALVGVRPCDRSRGPANPVVAALLRVRRRKERGSAAARNLGGRHFFLCGGSKMSVDRRRSVAGRTRTCPTAMSAGRRSPREISAAGTFFVRRFENVGRSPPVGRGSDSSESDRDARGASVAARKFEGRQIFVFVLLFFLFGSSGGKAAGDRSSGSTRRSCRYPGRQTPEVDCVR